MKPKVLWIAGLLAVFIAGAVFWLRTGRGEQTMTLAQVEAMVKSEVPLGASASKVENWIASKKQPALMSVSGPGENNSTFDPAGIIRDSGYDAKQIGSYLFGTWRVTHRSFLSEQSIQVAFLFDKKDRLVKQMVWEGPTSS